MKGKDILIGEAIVSLLKQDYVGKVNSVKRVELLHRLRIQFPNLSDRRMRLILPMIVEEWLVPVLTTSQDGYFFAANEEEVTHAANECFSRARASDKRGNCIKLAWEKHDAPPAGFHGHCESRGG